MAASSQKKFFPFTTLILELDFRNSPLKGAPIVKNASGWCYLITHKQITFTSQHMNLKIQITEKTSCIKKALTHFVFLGPELQITVDNAVESPAYSLLVSLVLNIQFSPINTQQFSCTDCFDLIRKQVMILCGQSRLILPS